MKKEKYTNAVLLTTTELAEKLGVSNDTIIRNARKCIPDKNIYHNKTNYWTEEEVEIISQKIENNKKREKFEKENEQKIKKIAKAFSDLSILEKYNAEEISSALLLLSPIKAMQVSLRSQILLEGKNTKKDFKLLEYKFGKNIFIKEEKYPNKGSVILNIFDGLSEFIVIRTEEELAKNFNKLSSLMYFNTINAEALLRRIFVHFSNKNVINNKYWLKREDLIWLLENGFNFLNFAKE